MNFRHRIDPKLATVVVVVLLAALVTLVRARVNSGPAFAIGADASTQSRASRTVDDLASASVSPSAPPRGVFARGADAASNADRFVVYVTGAVSSPGVYAFARGARVEDALRRAGGPSAAADLLAINLAQPLADGDMVLVPRRGDLEDAARTAALDEGPASAGDASVPPPRKHRARKHHKRRHGKRTRHRRAQPASFANSAGSTEAGSADSSSASDALASEAQSDLPPLDLNRASRDDLQTLPGIGAEMADRIVTFRELNGPFASADELLDVEGMTQSKLARLSQLIVVR